MKALTRKKINLVKIKAVVDQITREVMKKVQMKKNLQMKKRKRKRK